VQFGPPDDPPLELAERPPPRKLREEPQPLINTYPLKRKLFIALKWIGALVVIAGLAIFALLYFAEREIYTFTDEQGVVHMVDDLDKVPEKYRARVRDPARK
jgi:hypothetical protein